MTNIFVSSVVDTDPDTVGPETFSRFRIRNEFEVKLLWKTG
jgi:hypothetical protein